MYMIYDEVDLIANPLTSELNMPIPESKKELINLFYYLQYKILL